FGIAVERGREWFVGAFAVVNALGDVRDAEGAIIAGARVADSGGDRSWRFVDAARRLAAGGDLSATTARLGSKPPPNTTLCVVATNAPLGRVELAQLARAAGAALFRRITPAGTSVDGDVVFALAPAVPPQPLGNGAMALEALAVSALERAIERAVRTARGRDGVPGLAD